MTNFPFIALLTLVSTNWINIPGDFKRESGTNWVKQQFVLSTNVYVIEVTLCTNRTLYSSTQGTNGPTRWMLAMPPLPNTMTKE